MYLEKILDVDRWQGTWGLQVMAASAWNKGVFLGRVCVRVWGCEDGVDGSLGRIDFFPFRSSVHRHLRPSPGFFGNHRHVQWICYDVSLTFKNILSPDQILSCFYPLAKVLMFFLKSPLRNPYHFFSVMHPSQYQWTWFPRRSEEFNLNKNSSRRFSCSRPRGLLLGSPYNGGCVVSTLPTQSHDRPWGQ